MNGDDTMEIQRFVRIFSLARNVLFTRTEENQQHACRKNKTARSSTQSSVSGLVLQTSSPPAQVSTLAISDCSHSRLASFITGRPCGVKPGRPMDTCALFPPRFHA